MAQIKITDLKVPQRREAVRVNVPHLDMLMWSSHDGMTVAEAAKMINLSATGALLQSRLSYTPGAQIRCTFSLTGGGYFSLPAHIVRCMVKDKMTDRFMIAVNFKSPPQTEEALVRWIFRWMAHQYRLAR